MNNTIVQSEVPVKKQRKPRTKKADMIKKKEEMEKLKQLQPPKKRGRKPKGGKIVKTNINNNIEPMEEEKNIIIHLKCNLNDLYNNDNSIINKTEQYNPNIINIEPYNDEQQLSYTFINDKSETQQLFNKENNDYEIINNSKPHETIQQTTSSTNSSVNKENTKKIINTKLKELEMNLNLNNVNNCSACFWCTYEFNSKPVYIPSLYFQNKYDVYGCFCSPECACSYLFNETIDDNTKFERYQLLNYLYGEIYNYSKNIKPAPNPYYTLSKYYGNLSIQEYRQLLEYDRLLLVINKPLTKIYPELHEDNNDFETIYENKISLKKNSKIDKNKILNKVFTA